MGYPLHGCGDIKEEPSRQHQEDHTTFPGVRWRERPGTTSPPKWPPSRNRGASPALHRRHASPRTNEGRCLARKSPTHSITLSRRLRAHWLAFSPSAVLDSRWIKTAASEPRMRFWIECPSEGMGRVVPRRWSFHGVCLSSEKSGFNRESASALFLVPLVLLSSSRKFAFISKWLRGYR